MKNYSIFLQEDFKKLKWTSSGSNQPIKVEDTDSGIHLIVKDYNSDQEREAVEVVAAKIYELMGAATTKPEIKKILLKRSDGTNEEIRGLVSEFQENLHPLTTEAALTLPLNKKVELAKHFIASVLVRNHDVVGMYFDNLMYNPETSHIVHVDAGGSFHFRAMGDIKGGNKTKTGDSKEDRHPFPREPEELESMVFSGKGASKFFYPILKDLLLNETKQGSEALEVAGKKLKSIPDAKLRSLVIDGGLPEEFADRLISRKEKILERLPKLISRIKES